MPYKNDGTGGTNGATMRYELEANDDANAGLVIARDLLIPVEKIGRGSSRMGLKASTATRTTKWYMIQYWMP
jgi:catalase (peroxidase I)